jgi:hypothetical protein
VILVYDEENADSHSSKEKREKLSKRTKNTKLEIFSRHFAKKKLVRNFAVKSPKKRRENSEVFFPFLTFHHHRFVFFLSFFLSLRPRNQNSFFFSRAQKQKERD